MKFFVASFMRIEHLVIMVNLLLEHMDSTQSFGFLFLEVSDDLSLIMSSSELPTVTAESELIRFFGKIEEHSGQYVFSPSVLIAQISSVLKIDW